MSPAMRKLLLAWEPGKLIDLVAAKDRRAERLEKQVAALAAKLERLEKIQQRTWGDN